jgi:release factor glutamine methyltransferase
MTIDSANRLLIASLCGMYDDRESAAISSLVMEHLVSMSKSERLLHKSDALTASQQDLFNQYMNDLLKQRPVQYVLHEAWFGGLPFFVDERVLIPRPETEELVDWLILDEKIDKPGFTVLDIGTGSGCIPVCIKRKRQVWTVFALDISEGALEIAKKNSDLHKADIEFILCDIRDRTQWNRLPLSDLIVSNPPYIPEKLKSSLDKHVRDFEPSLALFAPDSDPILFYKIVAELALLKLKSGGVVFLEIHHDHSKDIFEWYKSKGFELELKKDFSGNNRMIKAWRHRDG